MSGVVTVTLPDGRSWTPKFVADINDATCIGCGRCFRVCGRDVLQMVGVTEDGEQIAVGSAGDEDDDEEYERKIMTIANQMNCVGCEACAKICPKKCYTHAPMEAP
ncbi:ferredoxin III, nif-specific [Candidatus Macondimonas diazotrophica]|jgi:Nif-specific ferredoxin III|uniref:Ferredoxin III n=1 Tax=Candidatus Macondimonas diazotrophica TaxID=2305248 RepID=A0A4Z0F8G1_9GAMM|nr:ferredoxin III, nif-specific [Candidatus Macondimonas diazotrophica]MDY6956924.1 ferredoxin III, nif-specific [Pseudomonadota bacterium]NCU02203.1 ferredoxin III, nif-specific [Candidatus Macondimonas diazotrophica]TFZ81877.1 ferredoxin III, nif-specific [Candidatus Macondimonas diazotrophica]